MLGEVFEGLGGGQVVFSPFVRQGNRRAYAQAYAASRGVTQVGEGATGAFVAGVADGFSVFDFDDEGGLGLCDGVTGFLEKAAGSLIHGGGKGDVCAVLYRPGVDVGDKGASYCPLPVGGFYSYFVDGQHPLEDRAQLLVGGSAQPCVIGFLLCSTYEGTRYQIAAIPSSYQGSGKVAVSFVLNESLWPGNEVGIGDVFFKEGVDLIYFFLRTCASQKDLLPVVGRKDLVGGGEYGV